VNAASSGNQRSDDDAEIGPAAFIRFDPPELQDGRIVVHAVPAQLREDRRHGPATPLGYLYEVPPDGIPDEGSSFTAGSFDQARMVWAFTGEITGLLGITEPMSPA